MPFGQSLPRLHHGHDSRLHRFSHILALLKLPSVVMELSDKQFSIPIRSSTQALQALSASSAGRYGQATMARRSYVLKGLLWPESKSPLKKFLLFLLLSVSAVRPLHGWRPIHPALPS